MSRDIPIIFSAPMVHALLDGHKTMTRRLAWRATKPTPAFPEGTMRATPWQNVRPGDRLWVRENFAAESHGGAGIDTIRHMATPDRLLFKLRSGQWMDQGASSMPPVIKWSPSIHMPRWASRLTLIVTATKVEPVQTISKEDAVAEGLIFVREQYDFKLYTHGFAKQERHVPHLGTPVSAFADLWRNVNGPESWNANPDVVALTFRVVKANIDAPEAKAA